MSESSKEVICARIERYSYRDAPYKRDDRRGSRQGGDLCKNCKRPGHYARECPNLAVCNNCSLPGHIAAECSTKSLCWNCKEPGHVASKCPNGGICHTCGKAGHLDRVSLVSNNAHRQASLMRYQEKRKRLCFDKKILYSVRKEVASRFSY